MSIGKDEAIAIAPLGVGGIVTHELVKEQVRHRRITQRRSGVPTVRLLHSIYGKKPQCIDRQLIQFAHNNLTLPFENTWVFRSRLAAVSAPLRFNIPNKPMEGPAVFFC
jgi:hypothetical protein